MEKEFTTVAYPEFHSFHHTLMKKKQWLFRLLFENLERSGILYSNIFKKASLLNRYFCSFLPLYWLIMHKLFISALCSHRGQYIREVKRLITQPIKQKLPVNIAEQFPRPKRTLVALILHSKKLQTIIQHSQKHCKAFVCRCFQWLPILFAECRPFIAQSLYSTKYWPKFRLSFWNLQSALSGQYKRSNKFSNQFTSRLSCYKYDQCLCVHALQLTDIVKAVYHLHYIGIRTDALFGW